MARRVWRVALPAVMFGAALAGLGWSLASQGDAEAAPRKAGFATKYDRVTASGNVFYRIPPGYAGVRQKGGVIMIPRSDLARGEINGVLLLSDGLVLDRQMRARLRSAGRNVAVQAIAIAAGGVADDPDSKMSEPERTGDIGRNGYELFSLVSSSKDRDAGTTRFTQYAIILFGERGDRAEIAMRTAYGSADRLEALSGGFNALLASMEFRDAGAPPPARLAAALPDDVSAVMPGPRAEPARSGRTGATAPKGTVGRACGVRYRQQCNFIGSGAFQNYSCLQVPFTPPGCR